MITEEVPVLDKADARKSSIELNKEVNALIDKALKGDKEAAARAKKLSGILLRRG